MNAFMMFLYLVLTIALFLVARAFVAKRIRRGSHIVTRGDEALAEDMRRFPSATFPVVAADPRMRILNGVAAAIAYVGLIISGVVFSEPLRDFPQIAALLAAPSLAPILAFLGVRSEHVLCPVTLLASLIQMAWLALLMSDAGDEGPVLVMLGVTPVFVSLMGCIALIQAAGDWLPFRLTR